MPPDEIKPHAEVIRIIGEAIARAKALPATRRRSLVITRLEEAILWCRDDAFRGNRE